MFEAVSDWIHPAGQWNSCVIDCDGDALTVDINGHRVNSATVPGGCAGRICLWNRDSRVEFRYVRIRPYRRRAVRERFLFDHASLSGWTVGYSDYAKSRSPHRWKVRLGRIVCSGEDQDYLITDEVFRNYVLEVDWRFSASGPRTPNRSGVVIHSSGTNFEANPRGYEINLPAVTYHQQIESRDRGIANQTGSVITCGAIARNRLDAAIGVRSGNRILRSLVVPVLKEEAARSFNRLKIVAIEYTIKVWVNDMLVSDVWNPDVTSGRIALRSQATAVEFSRVVIRELTGQTRAELLKQAGP